MSATGGSVKNVNIAGRDFSPVGDGEAQIDFGGYSSEYQANGNKTARKILTAKNWSVSGLGVELDSSIKDQEFLQEIEASEEDFAFTFTMVNNITYQGIGSVTGDLKGSSMSASGPVEFSGPGELTQQ